MKATRGMRQQLKKDNAKRPITLQPVPREQWPIRQHNPTRIEVWVSRHFLVQVFTEQNNVLRVSVNRTTARPDGNWDDNITWDDMQDIKHQIGRGDQYAVEVYPRNYDVVNVANMRHLWVFPEPLDVGWFR